VHSKFHVSEDRSREKNNLRFFASGIFGKTSEVAWIKVARKNKWMTLIQNAKRINPATCAAVQGKAATGKV